MKSTDFDVSPHRRNATALLVLGEAGYLDPQEKAKLLNTMWEGWRKVMCIRLGASIGSEWVAQKGPPPEGF